MSFEAAKCPSCNASIQVPSDREKAVCMFCGNILTVKEAIQKLKVELNGPVVVDANIETLLKSANGFLQLEKWDEAKKKFDAVVELDSTDYRGWWGRFLVVSRNMTLSPRRLDYTEDPATCDTSDAMSAMKIALKQDKEELQQKWEKYVQRTPKTFLLTIGREEKWNNAKKPYIIIVNKEPLVRLEGGKEITIELFEGKYVIEIDYEIPELIDAIPFVNLYARLIKAGTDTMIKAKNQVAIHLNTDSILTIIDTWKGISFDMKGGRIV